MARYDQDTETFIREVSSLTPASEHEPVFDKNAQAAPKILGLYQTMNNKYDREWFDWEPETLWQSLRDDFSIEADERLRNILPALQVTVRTNFPFEMWHVFENVGHAFNENPVSFAIVQPLDLDEVSLTMQILKKIRPKEIFERDVTGYAAASARNAGIVYLPEDMFCAGCQKALDGLYNDMELKRKVRTIWPATTSDNEMVDIQLSRLAEIKSYVMEKL